MAGPPDVGVAQFDGGRTWGTEEDFKPAVKSPVNMKEWPRRSWAMTVMREGQDGLSRTPSKAFPQEGGGVMVWRYQHPPPPLSYNCKSKDTSS